MSKKKLASYKMVSVNIKPEQYDYVKNKSDGDLNFNLSRFVRTKIDELKESEKCLNPKN